jgi:hypothetical protein
MPIDFVCSFFLFFSSSHDDSTWMNEYMYSFCCCFSFSFLIFILSIKVKELDIAAGHHVSFLYSISRRWLSMLWACHLIHKRSKW